MRGIAEYFIKYPVSGTILMVLILVFGSIGLKNTRYSFFPQAESRIIEIRAIYPGASPEEVEEGIITKIENNLKGVSGILEVKSVSSENTGSIMVEGEKGYDIDYLVQDVKNAVDQISSFPVGMEPVVVFKQEPRNFAISFAVTGDVSLKALKVAARKIEDDLRAMDGISKIALSGFPEEEIEVALDEKALRSYDLTFEQVSASIASSNIEITGGTIKNNIEEFLIRARSKEYTAEQINDIIVKATPDGRLVRLRDIGTVRENWSDNNPSRNYFNKKSSVTVSVSNTNEEDFLGIVAAVKEYIEQHNEKNDVISLKIIRDTSPTLIERRDLLISNGLQGFALVVIVLALALHWRIAFWVALSIPVSFAGMFVLAALFGITINVISLFGMILVVGILVDDGIVISENIYQRWERGETPLVAAINGTLEVFPSVLAAVLTTVTAFAVFYFLDGRLGDFFPDLAFVVIATLLVSLIEAALTLPTHIAHSKALRHGVTKNRIERGSEKVIFYLRDRIYIPLLERSLRAPLIAIVVPIALFMITLGAIGGGLIKTTFFPFIEGDNISTTLELAPGTRDYITKKVLDDIETAALAVNDSLKAQRADSLDVIINIEKIVGPRINQGSMNIQLLSTEQRNFPSYLISNAISEKVGSIPEAEKLSFSINTPFGKPISVSLQSFNLEELESAKIDLKRELSEIKDLKDVVDNDQQGIKEINVKLKDQAWQMGLTPAIVLSQVRRAFFGAESQRLQRGIDEVKIWARFEEEERSSMAALEDFIIKTPTCQKVPLKELATFEVDRGIVAINHLDGKREVRVEADIANPEVSSNAMLANVRDSIMPIISAAYPSISYTFEGQSKEMKKTSTSFGKAGPAILIVMIAIIAFVFRSVPQTIAILLMIPFGFIGVGWGHWVHNAQISMFSAFGMIALLGIMVNDSIVYVSAMNLNLKTGLSIKESIIETGRSRFRPIMLTSITTIAGLAPLIFTNSFQAQFLVPMAIAVAYGLFASTYTTLLVLPIVLNILNSLRFYLTWFWVGTKPSREEVEPAMLELDAEQEFEKINEK